MEYSFLKKIFLSLFILRERASRGGAEGERIPSRLRAVSTEATVGVKPMNREIMTWAKTKSWIPNHLSHPGTPRSNILNLSLVNLFLEGTVNLQNCIQMWFFSHIYILQGSWFVVLITISVVSVITLTPQFENHYYIKQTEWLVQFWPFLRSVS